jgi:PAS domain S-box-containing protein
MVELTGYGREELLDAPADLIIHEDDAEDARAVVSELAESDERETTFEFDLVPRDGEPFPCEGHMAMLTDENGRFTGTAGIIRDITDRKRREERLSRLLETSQTLVAARDREAVARVVAEEMADALGHDRSIVRLYDEERDALVPTARGSDDAAVVDRPAYAAGEGGPGRAFERGETLRLGEEIAPDEPVGEVGDPTDAVHISLGEHGVVTLETTDPVGFEEATVSMAEVLASIAAVALERADREQDLLRYRTVIENVQDMVYVRDTAGRFSLVTDPLADWLGRDREALVGAALADLLPASESGRRLDQRARPPRGRARDRTGTRPADRGRGAPPLRGAPPDRQRPP